MNLHTLGTKTISLYLAGSIFFTSCVSTTTIQSNPTGAKLYINGEAVGKTPYTHRDTKIIGSTNYIVLEKEGYAPLNTSFSRDEEADVLAIIGGCFFLVPFLWTMKYKPIHNFELISSSDAELPIVSPTPHQDHFRSKADKLRELKQLLDENVITKEEYEKEKAKILNAKDK